MPDPATELFIKATAGAPAAAPVTPPAEAPKEPEAAAPDATQAPVAAPPETETPEQTPEVAAAQEALALLDELGIAGEKREAAQSRLIKALNDAKGKNGRVIAETNRRLSEELAREKARREAFEEKFKQFQPILDAVKPPETPKADPVTSHPRYLAAIKAGYPQEEVELVLRPAIEAELRAQSLQSEIEALKQERMQSESERKSRAWSAALKVDEGHPVAWNDIEPSIPEVLQAHPELNEMGMMLCAGGATPEQMMEFLYSQVLRFKPALLTKTLKPPPTQAPGKVSATPVTGSSPAPSSATASGDEVAKKILEVSRAAR